MNRKKLIDTIKLNKNFLCIGLDPDITKLPLGIERNVHGVKLFCQNIIKETINHCISYKLNTAFFEALGWEGYKILDELIQEIPKTHFVIADAKRGDIGNTSKKYAEAFFQTMNCDAITINPYMGRDSVEPFLGFEDKWAIVLGLTSNEGSKDIELVHTNQNTPIYIHTMTKCTQWATSDQLMFVVGATQIDYLINIRNQFPDYFFLVPGVGAQGGSIADVCDSMMTSDIGLLINSSREIIYASSDTDYAIKAAEKAKEIALQMGAYF